MSGVAVSALVLMTPYTEDMRPGCTDYAPRLDGGANVDSPRRSMKPTATLLLLVAALGCGSSKSPGGGGGSGGTGGEGGTTGGGGQGGGESCFSQGVACSNTGVRCCAPLVCAGTCVQPPNSCPGSAGFGCLYGGCRGDVGTSPICSDVGWSGPTGATDTRSCGGCTGNPPPNYVCGDGGWIELDAGTGGGGGAGGAGGGGGIGGGAGGAGGAGGDCGKFGQPCCANFTCMQGACYGGTICSA